MMNVQRYMWLAAVALMGTLAGCLDGSGSSGFDITENAAIEQAIDTQECQDFEGLRICPADSGASVSPSARPTPTFTPPALTPPMDTPTLPVGTPGPESTTSPTVVPFTPTATARAVATQTPVPTSIDPPPMQIETNVSRSSDIVCAGGDGTTCSFAFFFVAIGFPPDASYRTAFRESPDQPWAISQPMDVVDSRPGHASFEDDVPIGAPANAPSGSGGEVQFAVLVFLSDPGQLPASVAQLADSGADFAYVLPSVPISTTAAQ